MAGELYLGSVLDPESAEPTGERLCYDASDLTTHGVIVGMTGSGKTGLGVGLIEEALMAGIPCLVLDPKGDMGNLCLAFPELRADDFAPWVEPGDDPVAIAEVWREGLEDAGVDAERRRAYAATDRTVYTPGSQSGVPINIVGSLAAPADGFGADPEAYRDEIEGLVSSLLTLAGIDADPVSSPEHILCATIVEHAWSRGHDLDLATLLARIQDPPVRKLGVFEVDAFFPKDQRTELAMRLNGLVASPSFAAWLAGPPIDVERLLFRDGEPRAAILTLSHLSDTERQFVVTLILSKLVSWMRRQPGRADLRALVYMDEVYGFCPPTAEPPSKKPILTILKQARAHGVGMVLATQNPVDLDYKAMSNAGTWMIGRLQTERDKLRITEGMTSATGEVDVDHFDRLISGLDKRQFVLHTTASSEPTLFGTRFVMSYLAGPLTRDQIARLNPDDVAVPPPGPAPSSQGQPETPATPPIELGDDVTPVAPGVAEGVRVAYLDPAAPWAEAVGADPDGTVWEAAAVARVRLRYDDRYAEVDHTEEYEAVLYPLTDHLDPEAVHTVDHDDRDLRDEPPAGPTVHYRLPDADVVSGQFWRSLEASLRDHLDQHRQITVWKHPELALYSRVGETDEEFLERCRRAADDRADAEIAELTERYRDRIDRVRDQLASAERRVAELEVDVSSRRQQEVVSGVGSLLRMVLSGKVNSRGVSGAASRRSQTRRTAQRLQTAQAKAADIEAEIAELEDELADEIAEITDRWEANATEIEPVEIGLERDDITVAPLTLCWLPNPGL